MDKYTEITALAVDYVVMHLKRNHIDCKVVDGKLFAQTSQVEEVQSVLAGLELAGIKVRDTSEKDLVK